MIIAEDSCLEQRAELLDAWIEKRRQIASLEYQASELLAERLRLDDAEGDEHPHHRDAIHRSMIAEYSAAGRIAQGSIEYAFTDAGFLDARHPHVREAFRRGDISAAHVREIVRAAGVVREAVNNGRADAEALQRYDIAAVTIAEHETPARTKIHLSGLAAVLAGSTTNERHKRAAFERSVTVRPAGDGLAVLTAVLPEHLAAAIIDRLTQMARIVIAGRRGHKPAREHMDDGEHPRSPEGVAHGSTHSSTHSGAHAIFGDETFTTDPAGPSADHTAADSRTIDQVRADLVIDLLLAADPSTAKTSGLDNIRGRIHVTVAATTLAGCDDRPAELDGHGPLHPDIARDLAGRLPGWSRLFLDPTGMVVETDNYSPTEAMRRHLRARDQHCRFPGCRMPVHRCQIDHTFDHAKGGRTEIHNLAHLCGRHHVLKHPDIADRHRWTARQSADGTIDWISPLGRTYRDEAKRRVLFV